MKININTTGWKKTNQHTINAGTTDWSSIVADTTLNQIFNHNVARQLDGKETYGEFFSVLSNVAQATATTIPEPPMDWFEFSKERIQPAMDTVTLLLAELRDPNNPAPDDTACQLKLANRIRNAIIREAKTAYTRHLSTKLDTAVDNLNYRAFHKVIKAAALGNEVNHTSKATMALRLPDGTRANNDKDNMSVMLPHCHRMFNNHRPVSPSALDHMKQRDEISEIGEPITKDEFMTAIRRLKNNKSPGANGIPAEAFKALDSTNLEQVYKFVCDFWDGTADYDEWHTGTGTPIPKTPDPDDPNQFRIINLMDVGSKIFSKIMTTRAYILLDKHGTKYQFGATPKVGCQDGNFVLRTATHLRRQHNLETYVIFADLVKAFDTSNHDLIIDIIRKLGGPTKFCNAIERLYTDLTVTLKIGKEKSDIAQSVGVRQGDNLSPVIFLLIMAAFSETLEANLTAANIPKTRFHRANLSNISLMNSKLTGHSIKQETPRSLITDVFNILYLDDGSFLFAARSDMIKGLEIINNTFEQLGLEMHVGSNGKKSKTEAMYFPTGSFFNHQNEAAPALSSSSTFNPAEDINEENYPITATSSRKQTFSRMTQKQRQDMYFASDNTKRIYLSDGTSYVDFTAHFKYLGTYISFDLTEDFDINNRITKASREMGRLRHFFQNQYIELKFKHQVFVQYIVNILLWGCKNWAIKEHHFLKLNSLIHRNIRSILRIKMSQVRDEHIKNTRIRKIFFNLPDAQNLVAIRSMTYIGKVARSPNHYPPKQLLTAFANNPRPQSGVIITNKKAIANSLHLLLPDIMEETHTSTNKTTGEVTSKRVMNKDGELRLWLHIALDEELWTHHIRKLQQPGVPMQPPNPNRPRRQPSPQQNNNHDETNHDDSSDEHQQHQHNPPPPRHDRRRQRRRNQHHQHHYQHHPAPPPSPPSTNHYINDYSVANVGRTAHDSLRAMGLRTNATPREIRTQFRVLSMIYHPDKYSPSILDITATIAQAHFQLLNNAYSYLRSTNN